MNPARAPSPRKTARGKPPGLTLLELLLAMLLLSVVGLAFSRFFRVVFKASIQSEVRLKGQTAVRSLLHVLEMDFYDMNEVVYASPTRIDFYMDSHRAPWYSPTADPDGDGITNLSDPDDDGDALDAAAPITRLRDLAVSISSVGWRQGFDLEDDDEDGDGLRDVLCRYEYTPPASPVDSGVLTRQFCFNIVCGTPTVVLDRGLRDFSFDINGTRAALELPANADSNVNGLIDRDDFDRLDGTVEASPEPLNQFMETRWITGVRVHLVINPSDTFSAPTTIDTEISPPLLGIKRKYP